MSHAVAKVPCAQGPRYEAAQPLAVVGWRRLLQSIALIALAMATITMSGCLGVGGAQPTATPSRADGVTPSTADGIILTVLNNIKDNGYDGNASVNQGLGGLWVNWRYGSQPLQTNLTGSGEAQDATSGQPIRHDRLTDLRYLHNLLLYKSLHPGDTQFDSETQRYTAIVKADFSSANDDRGWVYDELMGIYALSHDTFFQSAAHDLAAYFASSTVEPTPGVVYKTSATEPMGYYRVDLALEIGCALVQAGATFDQPQWTSQGRQVIQFVYDHAYVAKYHAFVSQMNNVLLPDGSLNPHETIMRGMYGHTHIEGGQVRSGAVAQIVLSLLHTYSVTHVKSYLTYATDLLAPFTSQNNTLGLWDSDHLGYYSQAVFPGPDMSNPGDPKTSANKKESGRQLQMLEAFAVANAFTHGQFATMQALMLRVAVEKAYYAPGHGYVYEMKSDWQLLTLPNGQHEDWVTTEAMGIALEGLFAVQESAPW